MQLATWNLNNRAGTRKFRPEAADAVQALDPDVVVFTEFFPKDHEAVFREALSGAGWRYQLASREPAEEIANRVLIASKLPLAPLDVQLPNFDRQFPANLCCASLPSVGISLVGVRIPAYVTNATRLFSSAWDWVEETAGMLRNTPAVMLGDFNASIVAPRCKGGEHFRRILADGWHRASPDGDGSYFGSKGIRTEIDHIIATTHCKLSKAKYVQGVGSFRLGDHPKTSALSDHAALMCQVG